MPGRTAEEASKNAAISPLPVHAAPLGVARERLKRPFRADRFVAGFLGRCPRLWLRSPFGTRKTEGCIQNAGHIPGTEINVFCPVTQAIA